MADFNIAYTFMMDNEDAPRACKQVPDATPQGKTGPCFAISGVNSGSYPTQFAAIAALPQDQREPSVQQFYHDIFWNHWFEQVTSDEVCKRVFDFAVNGGAYWAVKCLQQAVNSLGPMQIKEDGGWGPATLGAVNGADPDALVTAFKAKREARYQEIVDADPARQQDLANWTKRANK